MGEAPAGLKDLTLRVLVINPNSSPKNTQVIADAVAPYLRRDLQVDCVNPEKGPVGLESYYHNCLASVEVYKIVRDAEARGYDGVVIAAFGDPGVEGAKEIASIPVVGVAEASYALARLLGVKFLVIVSADTAVPRQVSYIKRLGIPDHMYAVRPIGLTIVDVMKDRIGVKELVVKCCEAALNETGSELVVMGCSGFSGFRSEIEKQLGVPVIDPVVAGIHVCEALARMGLAQSKVLTYRKPPEFEIRS